MKWMKRKNEQISDWNPRNEWHETKCCEMKWLGIRLDEMNGMKEWMEGMEWNEWMKGCWNDWLTDWLTDRLTEQTNEWMTEKNNVLKLMKWKMTGTKWIKWMSWKKNEMTWYDTKWNEKTWNDMAWDEVKRNGMNWHERGKLTKTSQWNERSERMLGPGLVEHCWAVDPKERPSAVEILKALHEIDDRGVVRRCQVAEKSIDRQMLIIDHWCPKATPRSSMKGYFFHVCSIYGKPHLGDSFCGQKLRSQHPAWAPGHCDACSTMWAAFVCSETRSTNSKYWGPGGFSISGAPRCLLGHQLLMFFWVSWPIIINSWGKMMIHFEVFIAMFLEEISRTRQIRVDEPKPPDLVFKPGLPWLRPPKPQNKAKLLPN